MISVKDLYNVLSAMVPLYVAMILAYGSVRWWKIFTPVQCAGINRFVAVFAVPLLSFHFISSNNPYKMDGPFILADSVAKLAIFVVLAAWARFSRNGSLDWLITLFSVATLPNTLVMGIPLLEAMYGRYYGDLMVQLVVLQCIVWYTLLLFLFELRAARLLVMEQFPDTAASIVSFKVDSDIVSLDGREPLETRADVRDDGKIRVTIRRSISSRSQALNSFTSARRSLGLASMPSSKAITPRPSNLTGADIHSFHSSRNNPRDPSSIHPDIYSLASTRAASPRQSNFTSSDVYSVQSSHGPTPRPSNVNEDNYRELHAGARATSSARLQPPPYGPTNHPLAARNQGQKGMVYLAENHGGLQSCPGVYGASWNGYVSTNAGEFSPRASKTTKKILDPKASPRLEDGGKELHMFVWSSTASPASEGGLHVFGGSDFGVTDSSRPANEPKEVRVHVLPSNEQTVNRDVQDPPMHPPAPHATYVRENFSFGSRAKFPEDTSSPVEKNRQNVSKSSTAAPSPKAPNREKPKDMPPPTVLLKLILKMVGRKLLHNPNTYSSLIGVLWALIAFRWNVSMPQIVSGSIKILSDAGLGMAMFSLGLFMALQPRLIACGTALASFAMAVRFLTGPAVMAASSMALGLRGVHLHAAIVQASLPQGIVPFVFAREYDLHPDILSTAVIFGMLIALPITLLYYVFLGL